VQDAVQLYPKQGTYFITNPHSSKEFNMISPELLRRFPFFNFMNDAQLKAVAMIAEE